MHGLVYCWAWRWCCISCFHSVFSVILIYNSHSLTNSRHCVECFGMHVCMHGHVPLRCWIFWFFKNYSDFFQTQYVPVLKSMHSIMSTSVLVSLSALCPIHAQYHVNISSSVPLSPLPKSMLSIMSASVKVFSALCSQKLMWGAGVFLQEATQMAHTRPPKVSWVTVQDSPSASSSTPEQKEAPAQNTNRNNSAFTPRPGKLVPKKGANPPQVSKENGSFEVQVLSLALSLYLFLSLSVSVSLSLSLSLSLTHSFMPICI